jgi:hypothetical protein
MGSSLHSGLTATLHPIAAALTGLLIWYGVFALLDRAGPARWLRPVLPLLLGFLSFRLLGMYLSAVDPRFAPHLGSLFGDSTLLRFIIDVGLREELIKLLLALPVLLWLTRPSAPTATQAAASSTAHLAAALVGIGFATAETRMFFTAHHQPTLLVGRVFSTTLLHAAATGLCGAALFRALAGGQWHAWARAAATLLLVAAAHGLYDWAPASGRSWLHLGGTSWLSQALVIALTALFLRHYRHTQPLGARGPAAAQWLSFGALLQYALALGLTELHHGTTDALWICARECVLFLPVILITAALLVTIAPRLSPPAEPHTAAPHGA